MKKVFKTGIQLTSDPDTNLSERYITWKKELLIQNRFGQIGVPSGVQMHFGNLNSFVFCRSSVRSSKLEGPQKGLFVTLIRVERSCNGIFSNAGLRKKQWRSIVHTWEWRVLQLGQLFDRHLNKKSPGTAFLIFPISWSYYESGSRQQKTFGPVGNVPIAHLE